MIFKKSQIDEQPPDFMKEPLSDKKELSVEELGKFLEEQKRMAQYYKEQIEDNYDRGFAHGFTRAVEELYGLYRKLI